VPIFKFQAVAEAFPPSVPAPVLEVQDARPARPLAPLRRDTELIFQPTTQVVTTPSGWETPERPSVRTTLSRRFAEETVVAFPAVLVSQAWDTPERRALIAKAVSRDQFEVPFAVPQLATSSATFDDGYFGYLLKNVFNTAG